MDVRIQMESIDVVELFPSELDIEKVLTPALIYISKNFKLNFGNKPKENKPINLHKIVIY